MEKLYKNIGMKIKTFAFVSFIVEAIASVIAGIVCFFIDEDIFLVGLCLVLLGPIVAFVGSWLLYGFGEIIDKLCDIEQNTRGGTSRTKIKEDDDIAKEKAAKEAENTAKKEEAEAARKEAKEKAKKIAEREAIEEGWKKVEYIEIECPYCYETLAVQKGESLSSCPHCDNELSAKLFEEHLK